MTCEIGMSHWNNTCRLCLTCEDPIQSIFDSNSPEVQNAFIERLMSIANIKIVEGDGLPSNICSKCCTQTERSYRMLFGSCVRDQTVRCRNCGLEPVSSSQEGEELCYNDCEENLLSHLHEEANDSDYSDNGIEGINERESSTCSQSSNSSQHKCSVCNRTLRKKTTLKAHIEVHMESTSSQKYNSDNGKKSNKICDYCGKSFGCRTTLKRHLFKHTGERPHKCEQCGKSFALLETLTKHLRIHTGEKPLTCKYCTKTFAQSDSLLIHVRTHTGEKPYQCASCGKCFSQICHMKRHTLTHTGEKPFKCMECDCAFKRLVSLKSHTKRHEWEKKNHKSGGYVFMKPEMWPKKSLAETQKYMCKMCEKTFSQFHLLDCHMPVHTGERPYKYTTSGKTFVQGQHPTRHTRVHTGERPYCCAVCGKTYKESQDLNKHSESHERLCSNIGEACNPVVEAVSASLNLKENMQVYGQEFSC